VYIGVRVYAVKVAIVRAYAARVLYYLSLYFRRAVNLYFALAATFTVAYVYEDILSALSYVSPFQLSKFVAAQPCAPAKLNKIAVLSLVKIDIALYALAAARIVSAVSDRQIYVEISYFAP